MLILKEAEAELLREAGYALDSSRTIFRSKARQSAAEWAAIVIALRGMK